METFDAIVVGGGPAGSTCARGLVRGGAKVAVIDAARFPRVKLCAGWVSAGVWDAVEVSPAAYPRGIWRWKRVFVHYRGRDYAVPCRGFFIRRYELDDFLLARSGARLITGRRVARIERDGDDGWVLDGTLRARFLIGAGGSNCPVARALFPGRAGAPVVVREREFEADPAEIAAGRPGTDGECELYLHGDLAGYSWMAPKTGWLNVGSGTIRARAIHPAFREARAYFERRGRIPAPSRAALDQAKGHSYHLYRPARLAAACRPDGALLVGDALGLAQPLTGEGILPAVLSGRLCAEAILAGEAASYPRRLARHPVFRDYGALHEALTAFLGAAPGEGAAEPATLAAPPPERSGLGAWLTARGFVFLFSGRPLPAPWALRALARLFAARPRRKRASAGSGGGDRDCGNLRHPA